MLSYFKKRKFQSSLTSHPNYRYRAAAKVYNQGAQVGILSNEKYRSEVEHFIKATIGKYSSVTCLFYSDTNAKEVDLPDLYNNKNINWATIPTGSVIDQFLSNEYDRLYYLETDMLLHQQYLYLLAKSNFSIGPLLEHNIEPFDLSIELKQLTISSLISEVKKGLDLLSHIS